MVRNYNNKIINTINDLKDVYKDGLPYQNKYRLEMFLPQEIQDDLDSYKFNIVCTSAEIPQREIKTQKIMFRGRPLLLKGQTSFQETFKVSIQEQGHFQVRKVLEKWLDLCDNLKGTSKSSYKVGEVYLYHLDTLGEETFGIVFYDVFITNIGSISLGDKNNDVITYDVTFSFSTNEYLEI